MSIKQQLHNRTWAVTTDYEEVLPYLDNDLYEVSNTYHRNGLFDSYYVGLK